jgi:hypothetical protein
LYLCSTKRLKPKNNQAAGNIAAGRLAASFQKNVECVGGRMGLYGLEEEKEVIEI